MALEASPEALVSAAVEIRLPSCPTAPLLGGAPTVLTTRSPVDLVVADAAPPRLDADDEVPETLLLTAFAALLPAWPTGSKMVGLGGAWCIDDGGGNGPAKSMHPLIGSQPRLPKIRQNTPRRLLHMPYAVYVLVQMTDCHREVTNRSALVSIVDIGSMIMLQCAQGRAEPWLHWVSLVMDQSAGGLTQGYIASPTGVVLTRVKAGPLPRL